MAIKLIDRIHGAIRGFKDPLYENVPFELLAYNAPTGYHEPPLEGAVIYLCDGEDPRCACHLKDALCQHTTDITHARNFKNIMNPGDNALWVEIDEEDKEVKTDES